MITPTTALTSDLCRVVPAVVRTDIRIPYGVVPKLSRVSSVPGWPAVRESDDIDDIVDNDANDDNDGVNHDDES